MNPRADCSSQARLLAPLLCVMYALLSPDGQPASARPASPPQAVLTGVADLAQVARVNGPGSLSQTDLNWQLYGADLGHMFSMGDRLYMVFGSSFGQGFTPPPGADSGRFDLRENTLAYIDDTVPAHGLPLAGMITDRPGHAAELLPAGPGEAAVVPTYGVAVGTNMYLHYMSVRSWDYPGQWTLNYSGMAVSSDQGQTWAKDPTARWPGTSNFGQVAIVPAGEMLYFFGIPGGRLGSVALARVPARQILRRRSYRYFSGLKRGRAQWSALESDAQPVAGAPVGELSVMWDAYLGRWIMTYLDSSTVGLVIREAPQLWGPWSAPIPLVPPDAYPQPYGAYLHPRLAERDGEIIYFTMSRWQDYSAFLMKARLVK